MSASADLAPVGEAQAIVLQGAPDPGWTQRRALARGIGSGSVKQSSHGWSDDTATGLADPEGSPELINRIATAASLVCLLLLLPIRVAAQEASADPARLLKEAHDRQEEFERYRASRIPVTRQRSQPVCDERIGRICIWYGGEGEEDYPPERPEVGEARVRLISFLADTVARAPNRWVLGQLVFYLIETRDVDGATRVATECGIPEVWWCSALRGYILHLTANYVDSEAAFREAIAAMPPDEREEWLSLHYLLTGDGEKLFERMTPAEREQKWELFWRLSDPLFLIRGNDRLTDHFARMVEAINWRDAANPMGMPWGDDMEATLIRYGRNIGYSRTIDPVATMNGAGDTRRVQGHHNPKSRGYLFPEEFLESPSDVPPESWITAPREARTWFAPRYAPEMRALESQVGRFRRDAMMFVVGAYRPVEPEPVEADSVSAGEEQRRGSFGIQGQPNAAMFLVPEDGSEPTFVRGGDPEGVLTISALPGRYVSGMEVIDLQGRQAWRARQGVAQLPLAPDDLDVSDLLILKEGAPAPANLEQAIPYVRPGVRIRRGERFPVVWEAYGLRVDEPVRITLGFTRGRPGFLTRVGEFLGVLEPDRPVEVVFEDPGPDSVQTAFRSIELQLPDLDPGEYTIHLRLELAGHEPVVTSRPIIVE